jgi:hypothetical protein
MSAMEEVDEEHLELVEMRLDIDVESLRSYLVANSDFPDGPVEIKQFNKGQSNPTVRAREFSTGVDARLHCSGCPSSGTAVLTRVAAAACWYC